MQERSAILDQSGGDGAGRGLRGGEMGEQGRSARGGIKASQAVGRD